MRSALAALPCVLLLLWSGAVLAQSPEPQAAPAAAPAPARPATLEVRAPDLTADYFTPAPSSAVIPGAVIVLGGSEGGLGGSRNLARRLAAEGFTTLAVSYFGEAGQNPRLDLIPIEQVARAREWLEAQPGFTGPVAVVGVSKGAELALIAASRDPRITAVVAGVPSDVVWQGIDRTGASTGGSWTQGGQPLTYVPYDMTGGFPGLLELYRRSAAAPHDPGARIPVEQINGPILMISGDGDTMWPSWEMANRIEAGLKDAGFAHPVTNLVYPAAGHSVFGPPIADPAAPGLRNALSVGGTIEGLVAARADGWPKVVDFLRQALTSQP
ncbi:MAG: dienelactone hydrolase [Brevundimonas sp.]|nr:MAG: dienelactone hydrolase [Brevundimonas sp.]